MSGYQRLNTEAHSRFQRLHPSLKQQVRTAFRPLHLLPFTEPFAHHLVHDRFHETRRDYFTVAIPLAVVRDEVSIVPDVRAELFDGFDQLLELGIRLLEVSDLRQSRRLERA